VYTFSDFDGPAKLPKGTFVDTVGGSKADVLELLSWK
jgi:hypothetical protein